MSAQVGRRKIDDNNHARLSIKKAKAQSLMSNSRGLGGVGGYFGVQVAGVAAPGAGSAAVNNTDTMAELSMPPAALTLPPWKGKLMSMIMEV